ncbi:MAG TPA: Gfo/Idh/MocA family oxidoreductase [Beijerinckiaceae bacterium]
MSGVIARPRIGFLGVGWIGRHRMQAVAESGLAEIVAVADPSEETLAQAAALAPDAKRGATLDDVLAVDVDAVVIATPSALHAEQSVRALQAGAAVFCQKPLGRSEAEAAAVIAAARAADRLLAVDLSYRFTDGMQRIKRLVESGELGAVHAVEVVFHNAYGPDKPWFYDRALAGGGCVMDLGVHLVDLALWTLGHPEVTEVTSALYAQGRPLRGDEHEVEDHAMALLRLDTGASVQLACSWRLQAGRDALISAAFYGAQGGAALRNVNGSFFDFTAERYRGTATETLTAPPDAWGGRAAVDFVRRLAGGARFDPECERLATLSRTLDRIYGRQARR